MGAHLKVMLNNTLAQRGCLFHVVFTIEAKELFSANKSNKTKSLLFLSTTSETDIANVCQDIVELRHKGVIVANQTRRSNRRAQLGYIHVGHFNRLLLTVVVSGSARLGA